MARVFGSLIGLLVCIAATIMAAAIVVGVVLILVDLATRPGTALS